MRVLGRGVAARRLHQRMLRLSRVITRFRAMNKEVAGAETRLGCCICEECSRMSVRFGRDLLYPPFYVLRASLAFFPWTLDLTLRTAL
jgi:hypothetical protein